MFTAELMSAHTFNDPSRSNFPTREAAWDYVATRLCRSCKEDLEGGTEEHPSDTMCGAEWEVNETIPTDNIIPVDANGAPRSVTLGGTRYQADGTGHWPALTAALVEGTRGDARVLSEEERNQILHASSDNIRGVIRFITMHYPEVNVLVNE